MVIWGDFLTVPLPFAGPLTLTLGKQRPDPEGKMQIPVVVKSIEARQIPASTVACMCLRSVVAKTCGGTLFEPDGVTLAQDCSDGFTPPGSNVCPADRPCAYVHGPGNVASGVIGCEGLAPINFAVRQDCNAEFGAPPYAPETTSSGSGGPGSALIHSSNAIGIWVSDCASTGSEPGLGEDGEFCTDDDLPEFRGEVVTTPLTTGTTTGTVLNVNDFRDMQVGPVTAYASPFSCAAVENGTGGSGGLVGASTMCGRPYAGDIVGMPQLALRGCLGDCSLDGVVTVEEIIASVNIALGLAPVSACAGADVDVDGRVSVDEILEAVVSALQGCAAAASASRTTFQVHPDEETTDESVGNLPNPVAVSSGRPRAAR
jgi:hypothetical protein